MVKSTKKQLHYFKKSYLSFNWHILINTISFQSRGAGELKIILFMNDLKHNREST